MFYRRVFEDPSVDNLIFLCQRTLLREQALSNKIVIREIREGSVSEQLSKGRDFDQNGIKCPEYAFELDVTKDTLVILKKIENASLVFGSIGGSYFGIQTNNRNLHVADEKVGKFWMPVIDGGNVFRYSIKPHTEYVDFQPKNIKSGGDPEIYAKNRIVVRQIGKFPEGSICPKGVLTLNTIYNLYIKDNRFDLNFVLGIINSRLVSFYWLQRFYDNKETFPKIKKQPLHSIPIRNCTRMEQDPIIELVKETCRLKAKSTSSDTTEIETRINGLVYALYGLTPEEIRVVEESTAR